MGDFRWLTVAPKTKEMPYGIEALFRDDSGNFWSMGQKKS